MSGTGLKKCIPTSLCGLDRPFAIAVTEIEDVFVARTQSLLTIVSRSLKRARLTSSFSIIASITNFTELAS